MAQNAGRRDYDNMIRMTHISPDEPVFILRAPDPVAADTIEVWAEFQRALGAPSAVLEAALKLADQIRAWPHKKAHADADHLSDAERLRLAHDYRRRGWNWGALAPAEMARQNGFISAVVAMAPDLIDAHHAVFLAAWLSAKKITVERLVGAGLGEGDAAVLRVLMREAA